MKSIVKNLGALGLKALNGRTSPTTTHEATRTWDKFSDKKSLLNALLAEQYHLCCYSELRADEAEIGYHIEHIENKSQNPARTFDPMNLAASAIDSNDGFKQLKQQPGGLQSNLFGGHAPLKTQGVDMTQLIHPQMVNCADFFQYLSDGRIIPHCNLNAQAKSRAQYTIECLNLNSPYLKTLRKNWWKELLKNSDNGKNDPTLVKIDLLPAAGKLNSFFSLTCQFYRQLAQQTLNQ
jgi:uncharacterized protein (TIGR02646 family)